MKLINENMKLIEDSKFFSTNKNLKNISSETAASENELLKRQIKILEEKLKQKKNEWSNDFKVYNRSQNKVIIYILYFLNNS